MRPSHQSAQFRDRTPIEVVARGFGMLQWMCPFCQYLHGNRMLDWRHALVTCGFRWDKSGASCRGSFRVGFNFLRTLTLLPPFNAILMPGLRHFTTNRLGLTVEAGESATARFLGTVEYLCPTCHTWNWQKLDALGGLTCTSCLQHWLVGVIFHRPTSATVHLRCPRDWSVSREFQAP